jgi:hypothetical protein
MGKVLIFMMVVICAVATASAQTELDLKQYFEGRHVTLKMNGLSYFRQVSYRYVAGGLRKSGVVRVGPPTTYLKEGLTTEEVLRLLGKPSAVSERVEQGLVVTTYEFPRGEDRILFAEFTSDALVRTRIETRSQRNDRTE